MQKCKATELQYIIPDDGKYAEDVQRDNAKENVIHMSFRRALHLSLLSFPSINSS